MHALFPSTSFFSEKEISMRAPHQWVMPTIRRSNRSGIYKVLPPGRPDCLRVDIIHTGEGTERCTAAIYGRKAYVIHYEFKKYDERESGWQV